MEEIAIDILTYFSAQKKTGNRLELPRQLPG
jgi:hypothetical protein